MSDEPSNVVALTRPAMQPKPGAVTGLEEVLLRVMSGEIRDLIVVGTLRDGEVVQFRTGGDRGHPFALIGALEDAKYDILLKIER